jgi:hypothetical protein
MSFFRNDDSVDVSWRVSTNEDVANFRLELRTKSFPHSTIFQQDLDYSQRYQVRGRLHLRFGCSVWVCVQPSAAMRCVLDLQRW